MPGQGRLTAVLRLHSDIRDLPQIEGAGNGNVYRVFQVWSRPLLGVQVFTSRFVGSQIAFLRGTSCKTQRLQTRE